MQFCVRIFFVCGGGNNMFDVALNKREALKGLFEEVKLEKDKMMGWLRLKK